MSKLRHLVAVLVVSGTSLSMANVTLDFVNTNAARDFSASGDSITLDFNIDGGGGVSMIATPVGSGTDAEYLAAVNSWSGSVGTVSDPLLFGDSVQLTIFVTTAAPGTERISVDGRYLNGIMGVGGGNGSRIDFTSGPQEMLHFSKTAGSANIKLLDFEWHAASSSTDLWDMQLIAGGVDNTWIDLPGNTGTVDVSGLGYVIGGGNDLTFQEPLTGSHGLGLGALSLEIVVPEPATTGMLGLGAIGMLLIRRFRKHA